MIEKHNDKDPIIKTLKGGSIMDNIIGSIILEGAATVEDVIVADKGNNDRVLAEGTLQDMDVENRNHRIYAKKDLEPEIKLNN